MSGPPPQEDVHAAGGAGHLPVMAAECLQLLAIQPGQTVVDATAGRGGHAALMSAAAGAGGRIVVLDVDAANLAFAAARMPSDGARVEAVHASFDGVESVLARSGARADALLADLGFASTQVDDASRGFSFVREGPLDMRLNPAAGQTAAQLVAQLGERELADAIYQLGEDPFARAIARQIVRARAERPIATTLQLAQVVRAAYGRRAVHSRMNPATRTFMALRILVNDELGALERLLRAVHRGAAAAAGGAPTWLQPGARVAVISFHSLEDRLVKRSFGELAKAGLAQRLTTKPITASPAEQAHNPRARSAKLRAVRVVPDATPVPARSLGDRG